MNNNLQAVIIGEVLFDLFDDGQAVLGGAPFNVAWHLQGFGQSPLLISRVGVDEHGANIRQTMLEWGMDVGGLQTDPMHPTGLVQVSLNQGQPTFTICDEAAYDYIDVSQVDSDLAKLTNPFLYHGSLAARHPRVFDLIQQMRQGVEHCFVDINLRSPWWGKAEVMRLIDGANWLKLNEDELHSLKGVGPELADMIDATKVLMQDYHIDIAILTRGEQSACIISRDRHIQSQPVAVDDLQDTVGAGDAFSSVCMLGMIHDWPHELILQRATAFAAKICEQRGATSMNTKLYDDYKGQWHLT